MYLSLLLSGQVSVRLALGMASPVPFPEAFVAAELFQSCLTLCHPMYCSTPGSSVHRISQARTLEWVALTPGDLPDPGTEPESPVSCIGRRVLYHWATWDALPRGPLGTLKHSHSLSHSAPCFIWGISEILLLIYTLTFLFSVSPEEQGFVLCSLPAPGTVTGPQEAFWAIYQTTEFGIWILLDCLVNRFSELVDPTMYLDLDYLRLLFPPWATVTGPYSRLSSWSQSRELKVTRHGGIKRRFGARPGFWISPWPALTGWSPVRQVMVSEPL